MAEDITTRGVKSADTVRRSYPTRYEVRSIDAGARTEVTGYASTVEQPYEMFDMFGSYTEVVRSGAFAKTLGEKADVAFLINHGGVTMARTKSGTLHLEEDSTGLLTVATLNSARNDVHDLLRAIDDGDIDEMSFAFRVERQEWSPDWTQRDLTELNLNRGDVSAVNYGANPSTTIAPAARSFRSPVAADQFARAVDMQERAGNPLSRTAQDSLARVLDDLAASPPLDVNDTRSVAYLDLLRRRHALEIERGAAL